MKLLAILTLSLALAGMTSAQCSTLAITGSVNFGQSVSIDVTGAPAGSIVLIGASQSLGSTSFSFGPLGGFSLDIAQPLMILPMGMADATGAASLDFTMPAAPTGSMPTIPSQTLHCQSVAVSLPSFTSGGGLGGGLPTLGFCVSNTATLQVF